MKKVRILLILFSLSMIFFISACAMGPRNVGAPGLSTDGEKAYLSFQMYVYAVNLSEENRGMEMWRFPSQGNQKVIFYSPPEILDDNLYVGDLANTLHKLDKNTGVEVWAFSEAKGWFIGQVKATNEFVLAQSSDRALYKIPTNNINEAQKIFENEDALWAQPVINDNYAYIGAMDSNLYAINLQSGGVDWNLELNGAIISAPLFNPDHGLLYVGTLGRSLYAVNLEGQIVWQYPESDSIGSIWTTPILHDNQVIFVDEQGKLFSLDSESGKEIWSNEAGGNVMAGLLALDDRFILVTEDGNVFMYNYDGKRLSTFFKVADGEVYTTPIYANGVLVVAVLKSATNNLLYGYDLEGRQVFSFKPEK